MRVAESIRRLRESKDLTQEQFGKIAGVSSMAVSQWENGRAVPRMGAIQKLSDFFNVPKSAIMGDEEEYDQLPASHMELSDKERRLVELYREMDAQFRAMLLKSAEAYAGASVKEADVQSDAVSA